MTNDVDINLNNLLSRREVSVLFIFFLVVFTLTLLDIYEDWLENAPLTHIIPEALIAVVALLVAFYLVYKLADSRFKLIDQLNNDWRVAKQKAVEYQQQVLSYKSGVTQAITKQLDEWRLTPAEQEVSLLLLKGFSLQEIADLRGTAERTIRQQSSVIYKKSGLKGRAELSAYFLEDLLV